MAAEKLAWALPKYQIDTSLRVAHMLAQLAHESGFIPIAENLNYSAKRLPQVWPTRFPTLASAQRCANNPEALSNTVYAGRLGNGSPESGDGYCYRGRGMIQLTGREHYRTYGKVIGHDLERDPDLLLQYGVSSLAAGAFWKARGLNRWADINDVTSVTRIINGELNGLQERIEYLHRAKRALGISTHGLTNDKNGQMQSYKTWQGFVVGVGTAVASIFVGCGLFVQGASVDWAFGGGIVAGLLIFELLWHLGLTYE
ncbi:glycoside hydrolase family 19 protein [Deinococcus sp. QL22]|uniref:glycoside hydrolase family 19 protein n=1 Tax=Deinococcus sp. QL22 TaxID=2939437 RepID=UPI002017B586|nr:glycoside hydrolase family 19 protein [Deinococcus sp. QL22]UQN08622.1 glycoside hydrolase family 19 protein [Deinococcus sp. QL22]